MPESIHIDSEPVKGRLFFFVSSLRNRTSFMSQGILDNLGVYGWKNIEDLVFAGYVGEFGILIVGQTGTAKTLAFERIGMAMKRAYRLSKDDQNQFISKYRNASTANVQDIIGYPMPPSAEEASEMREKGERPEMHITLAPDSVIDAHQLVIDEINRAPHQTQNKWLSLVNERRVDGHDLENLRHVVGLMNPVHEYEGTEVLDRAYGNRFSLLIRPPTFEDFRKQGDDEAQKEITEMRLKGSGNGQYGNDSVSYGEETSDDACLRVKNFIDKAKSAQEKVSLDYQSAISEYVCGVVNFINENIGGGVNTQALITSREASQLSESIVALQAVGEVKGRGNLQDNALDILLHSFLHEVFGDQPIQESVIRNAHDAYEGCLESKQDRIMSEIRKPSNRAKRVVRAINLPSTTDMVSSHINQAHNHYAKKDEVKRLAFSLTLFSRLQKAPEAIQNRVNVHVLEELVSDVERVLKTSRKMLDDPVSAHPALDSSSKLIDVLEVVSRMKETKRGRIILALTAEMNKLSQKSPSRSGTQLSADSKESKRHNKLETDIRSCARTIKNMCDVFEEIEMSPDNNMRNDLT